ncbi:hypothetical protein F4861DRAFT_537934 [Xylaria intraflava]|nr:hypothetical protein F4861DRAFT_537934 [Xylaria intraflava]
MQLSILKVAAFAAALQTVSATPMKPKGHTRQVIATTKTSDGQTLDWVVPESQVGGKKIATPPAPPKGDSTSGNKARAALRAGLGNDPGRQGPNGTVPVLRAGNVKKASKRLPTVADHDNGGTRVAAASSGSQGMHWYASSGQAVTNMGGKGTFSLFKAFTQSTSDFSLLQTAVIRTKPTEQTVEAGWINYPSQISDPHLFSYYTTNGYTADGDNIGGWNTDNAGWVQVDDQLYPGITFSPLSADGGSQYELEIGYYLTEGNWWLWCLDRYIGYYPASLFSAKVSAKDSLGDHSDLIDWYGEIYNSEVAETTTDMGSGELPSKGYGKSAYIHNIMYVNDKDAYVNYNGGGQLVVSDKSRYNIAPTWNSGSTWGSYFYLGGPGAGGKVGA